MISFKGGVLRVHFEEEEKARKLYDVCFVINMVVIFAGNDVKRAATVSALLLFASSMFLWVGRKKNRIVLPYNALWYLVVVIFMASSWIWSETVATKFLSTTVRLLMIWIVVLSISIYVDTLEDLERMMSLFIFSVFIIIALELSYVPFDQWFEGAMGGHFSGCNTNEVAFWVFCAEMMAFYKAYINGQKGYYVLAALLLLFVIMTSSRKATIAGVIAPIFMMILSVYKKNYLFKIIGMVALGVFLVYMIMNNEYLYNSIGFRFDSMLNFFSDETTKTDGSMELRTFYIEYAKTLFVKSPIVGNGMGSFMATLAEEYGETMAAYSHNNYWQLLSEFGIVGLVLYYSFYVFCIVRLAKEVLIDKSRIAIVFLTFFVVLMGLEYGIVTVNSKTVQIVISIAYTSTYIGLTDGRRYQYIENTNNSLEEK